MPTKSTLYWDQNIWEMIFLIIWFILAILYLRELAMTVMNSQPHFSACTLTKIWPGKKHISEVTKKVSRALFSIKQVKHVLPLDSLRTLYFALIHPHLCYGITVWGNADNNIIKPAILLQKWAIRVINNAPYNSHTDPKSGILKLNDLFDYQSLLFITDYMSNHLPDSFNSFPTNRDMHSRTTRQSKLLHIPTYSSKYAQRQPLFFLPKLWNEWNTLLPDNTSRYRTKRIIKSALLQKYPSAVRCENLRCLECYTHWT